MPKNIVIVEVKPPIPTHDFDYCAYVEGAGETDYFSWASSEEYAKEDLEEWLKENEEDGENAEVEE